MSLSTSCYYHMSAPCYEKRIVTGHWQDLNWRARSFPHPMEAPFEKISIRRTGGDLYTALGAYKSGLISLGRAAEIAELPYDKMIDELRKRGISLRFGPASVEEAEAEEERLLAAIKRQRSSP
jgi:predicted HTH domain antitoxin